MPFSFFTEIFLSLVLGIVQGITEFLPISSTAHLRLVTAFLTQNKDIGVATSNIIQLGTLVAIMQYFWPDLAKFFKRALHMVLKPAEFKVFWQNSWSWLTGKVDSTEHSDTKSTDILMTQIALGTVPIVILGFIFKDLADNVRSITFIAAFLILGSVLMQGSELIHKRREKEPKTEVMKPWEVLLIGLFQCIAILPGMSRSGSTVSGALLLGRDRTQSVRFSFLLSVPALFLAGMFGVVEIIKKHKDTGFSLLPKAELWTNRIDLSLLGLGIAFIFSYVFGLIFLKWLLNYLSKNTFKYFVVYRLGLALVLVILMILQVV